MRELPFDHLPRNIAQVLGYRGRQLMPLNWFDMPQRSGQMQLDQLDDKSLFAPHEVNDAEMAGAVRALCYLWSGASFRTSAMNQSPPNREATYIDALVARHESDPDESKRLLSEMDGHDIYPLLIKPVKQITDACGDKHVRRLGDLISMDERWEAFAFADTWCMAAEEQLTAAGTEAIREIQQVEFNLLMNHCYQPATGINLKDLVGKPKPRDPEPVRRKPRPTTKPARSHVPPNNSLVGGESPKPADARKEPSGPISVACPKCAHPNSVPADKRGQMTHCGKCKAAFLVPGEKNLSARAPMAASNLVHVACPKCQHVEGFGQDKRGQAVKCPKCGSTFKIGQAKQSVA